MRWVFIRREGTNETHCCSSSRLLVGDDAGNHPNLNFHTRGRVVSDIVFVKDVAGNHAGLDMFTPDCSFDGSIFISKISNLKKCLSSYTHQSSEPVEPQKLCSTSRVGRRPWQASICQKVRPNRILLPSSVAQTSPASPFVQPSRRPQTRRAKAHHPPQD